MFFDALVDERLRQSGFNVQEKEVFELILAAQGRFGERIFEGVKGEIKEGSGRLMSIVPGTLLFFAFDSTP